MFSPALYQKLRKNLRRAVVAHVPVDKFTIVNGPSATRCMKIIELLHKPAGEVEYVQQLFTLTTAASTEPFMRNLNLANVLDVQDDGTFTFVALFSNSLVSGIYSPSSRTGWFNLD